MQSALRFDLETLVSTAAPAKVTTVGLPVANLLEDYQAQQTLLGSPFTLEHLSLQEWQAQTASEQRAQFVILNGALESLDRQQGLYLISGLRDRYSDQFCVAYDFQQALESHTPWSFADFLSLGLTRVNHYRWDGVNAALFKYSLAQYKRTPDWLNADNWANPELWGKYWW